MSLHYAVRAMRLRMLVISLRVPPRVQHMRH